MLISSSFSNIGAPTPFCFSLSVSPSSVESSSNLKDRLLLGLPWGVEVELRLLKTFSFSMSSYCFKLKAEAFSSLENGMSSGFLSTTSLVFLLSFLGVLKTCSKIDTSIVSKCFKLEVEVCWHRGIGFSSALLVTSAIVSDKDQVEHGPVSLF